ncbi:uncharacterized protein LOC134850965 [Symsagittifera roscoffensis]|uniref:uncharacterized protein LOC134850965 n=1 Tax=Symsagittifera roscoffensis TaxID=84072 RepID=UPI00307C099D
MTNQNEDSSVAGTTATLHDPPMKNEVVANGVSHNEATSAKGDVAMMPVKQAKAEDGSKQEETVDDGDDCVSSDASGKLKSQITVVSTHKQNPNGNPQTVQSKQGQKSISSHPEKSTPSEQLLVNNNTLVVEVEQSGELGGGGVHGEGSNNNNNIVEVDPPPSLPPRGGPSAAVAKSPSCSPHVNTTMSSSSSPEAAVAKPVLCLRLIISSGSTAEFTVDPEWTVREITAQVHSHWPTQWVHDPVPSDPTILRLIYQGRFLHSSMTLKALNLQEGHTVVMHLVPRETLPESNLSEDGKKSKREREGHCCVVL